MSNRRLQTLSKASKRGLTLYFDPRGDQNRCFHRCLAKSLDMTEDNVVGMLESFMISNQVISCFNKDGEFEEKDLFQYLSDADFPRLGKRPSSWVQAVEALRNEMITHIVILSAAALFALEMHIIDWEGRSDIVRNPFGKRSTKIFLAYTGDHYMLLRPSNDACQISKATSTEKHHNAPQFHHHGPEEYNPGVGIFKETPFKLDASKEAADCSSPPSNSEDDMKLGFHTRSDVKEKIGPVGESAGQPPNVPLALEASSPESLPVTFPSGCTEKGGINAQCTEQGGTYSPVVMDHPLDVDMCSEESDQGSPMSWTDEQEDFEANRMSLPVTFPSGCTEKGGINAQCTEQGGTYSPVVGLSQRPPEVSPEGQ